MALLSKSLLPFTCRPSFMLTAPCAVQVRFLFLEAVADPKKMAQLNSGQAYAAQVCFLLGCFLQKALQPLFAALDMFLSAGLGSPAVPRLHLWPLYIPGEHSRLSRGGDLLFASMQCTGRPFQCLLCGGICTLGVPQLPALSTCLLTAVRKQSPSHGLQDGLARSIPTWHSLWLTFAGELFV